jgi:hypothetical protein
MNSKKTDAPVVRTFSEYLPEPYIDEVSDSVKYYGWAPMGTSEDEDGWRIMRETKDGTVTKREYAQGTMDFVSSWSKRTSYVYSR